MIQWVLQTGGKQDSPLSSLQTSLDAFHVNQNPRLKDAIEQDDLQALQRLFDAKLARPSDHVLEWEFGRPQSLIEVGIGIGTL